MNFLGAAGLGLLLGVVTGLPLGVVNVAVVDASSAGHRRYATGLGLGCAIADTVHSLLAFVGVGRLVTERPDLVRILAIVGAIVIAGYAALAWPRYRGRTIDDPAAPPVAARSLSRAIPAGIALTLPNPGALTAWVAIAAALWPHAALGEAIGTALGVGIGSATWFALLAYLVSKLRANHPALKHLPVVALAVLIAIAIGGVARVL